MISSVEVEQKLDYIGKDFETQQQLKRIANE